MEIMNKPQIKIATIDLYNNERNEGMRCIKEIVSEAGKKNNNMNLRMKFLIQDLKVKYRNRIMIFLFHQADQEVLLKMKKHSGKKITSHLIQKIWNHNQKI